MPRQSTLSRREFMRAAAASVAASSVAGLFARTPILRIASADANPKNRPNILFLLMDDMG
jgi:hypothetical protein